MRLEETIGLSHILKICEHESRQKIDSILLPLGLTSAQYAVLSVIESGQRLTSAEIARRCFVAPQTMNRIMQGLMKLKLVKKIAHPEHGLKLDYVLTPKAVKLVCDAHLAVNKIELEMIKNLNQKDIKNLIHLLNHCFKNLRSTL